MTLVVHRMTVNVKRAKTDLSTVPMATNWKTIKKSVIVVPIGHACATFVFTKAK